VSNKTWRKKGSIKNNKLCETNPISEKPKMIITLVITMTNNNKQRTMNYQKQSQFKTKTNGPAMLCTQSKPTCSELDYTIDETKKSV
jgi:hypothetical protein